MSAISGRISQLASKAFSLPQSMRHWPQAAVDMLSLSVEEPPCKRGLGTRIKDFFVDLKRALGSFFFSPYEMEPESSGGWLKALLGVVGGGSLVAYHKEIGEACGKLGEFLGWRTAKTEPTAATPLVMPVMMPETKGTGLSDVLLNPYTGVAVALAAACFAGPMLARKMSSGVGDLFRAELQSPETEKVFDDLAASVLEKRLGNLPVIGGYFRRDKPVGEAAPVAQEVTMPGELK